MTATAPTYEISEPDADEVERARAAVLRAARWRRRSLLITLRVAFVVAVLLVWELLVAVEYLREFSVGRPTGILEWFRENLFTSTLWHHFFITVRETGLALLLGIVGGVALAVVLTRLDLLHKVLQPFITAAFVVPRISLMPLFILWFGVGETAKVMLGFTIVIFIIFFNTYAGITSVDRRMVDALRSMGASRRFIYQHVVLPHSLPHIFTGIRVSAGLALVVVIAAEFIAGSGGLGYLIVRSANLFFINEVMGLIILLGLLGLAVELVLSLLERRLFAWRARADL